MDSIKQDGQGDNNLLGVLAKFFSCPPDLPPSNKHTTVRGNNDLHASESVLNL